LLVIVDSFSLDIHTWLDLPTEVTLQSGFHVGVGDVAGLLAVLVVAVLAGRRFLHARIEERLERHVLDQELEQARELQQHVLIPGPVHSGVFAVETAYHPARVVGGDFFQAIPIADGSLLIVVGDVSGKGIAAAMLVAVLVGSIRTRAEETSSPAALLATLNQRLLGRSGGHFATCIAAHLRPDGTLTLANAGHLAPYRDGQETELDFALPLGITDHTGYTETVIKLFPGETLTFLSDGVVEAQSASGELFGFERTRQISTQSAEAIAAAAQAFGQEDDITVLTLTFAPVEVLHA
jgi:phosphoserine phosphatase RsbU/P